MNYVILLVGFVLLIKGADYFVDGSSSIAGILKVPSVIIGLTIVAMGTSAPEAAVSITAGIAGNSDLSVGNIVGSNIFNLLIVIGVCALIRPVVSHKDIIRRDLWWNLGISMVLLIMILDCRLNRAEGVLLLAGMAVYLIVLICNARKNRVEAENITIYSVPKSILLVLIGLVGVVLGGKLVVDSASSIAQSLGMSDTLIGLTIVAIGTSLPELVTSIVAARRGDSGIALGNAVGSCIFNIMFILGFTAMLSPVHVASELLFDTAALVGVGILILICALTQKKTTREEGILYIVCYMVYSAYIIIR